MAKDEDGVRDGEESLGPPVPDDAAGGARLPAAREEFDGAGPDPGVSPASQRGVDTRNAYEQVKHTRSAALWSGLLGGAVVLLLLLVFIVQNQQNTEISLIFWKTTLPLGVSLLIAAIGGALLVGLAGALRIIQLRRAAKKLQD
ncbi:lipopolysaccharide assembly protein LapA domain-containing protein [Tsukamurella sp. NPDC003166]|uniref:LapA family protein n=1 Tax=Tsukamurella sp. NPDC003166 TaxID=3154444 RepID=UPI0033BDF9C4